MNRRIEILRCAVACGKDPGCKAYSVQRNVHSQCVTYGEDIHNSIPDNVSKNLYVRGKSGNFLS